VPDLRSGKQVRIDDLATDQHWRDYAVRALAHGVRSSLSTPLITPDRPVGAFNLYSDTPGFFGGAETRLAERFAREAAVVVGIAARLAAQAALIDQLRASLASRAVIDQALGVLMGQRRCTAAEAFVTPRAVQGLNLETRPHSRTRAAPQDHRVLDTADAHPRHPVSMHEARRPRPRF
jgi:GAF domain-containing protein